jgi:endo-1,4-beta-D-glucanase Y
VLNSGRTFLIYFSYCPSESDESFSFIWESLKEEYFKPNQNLPAPPPPRVFLGNQAGGLISSIPKAWPDAQVQSYDWHAVEAMKQRYRKSGYKKKKSMVIGGWKINKHRPYQS